MTVVRRLGAFLFLRVRSSIASFQDTVRLHLHFIVKDGPLRDGLILNPEMVYCGKLSKACQHCRRRKLRVLISVEAIPVLLMTNR
jgi:hypothetical protein